MNWQLHSYLWPLLVTALVSASLVFLFYRRRQIPGAVPAAALMVNNTAWALYYMLELASVSLDRQVFWAKMQYTGIVAIPALWFIFTLTFTRRDEWLTRRNTLLLYVVPIFTLLIVFTNDLHHLFWTEVNQVNLDGVNILQVTHGPSFWVFLVFSYIMLALGTLVLGFTYLEAPALYRRQILILLGAASIPWISNFLYISGNSPWPLLDLTPFAFALTGVLIAWGLLRYGLLELLPLARDRLLEMMPDGVIVADMSNRILDLNPAARRLLHQPSGKTKPVNHQTFMGSPVAPPVGVELSRALAGWPELAQRLSQPGEMEVDVPLETGDGWRYFSANVALIHSRSERPDGRLIVLREVTGRKQVEAETQYAREAAEQANRAKSAFLAAISHELRTPLTMILGYSEMLGYDQAVQQNEHLLRRVGRIETAGKHLMSLITDVLDFSKIEAGQVAPALETFSVQELIEESTEISHHLIDSNHNRLSVTLDPHLNEMYSDRTFVRQILFNLLGNAAKFTDHGEIQLRARPVKDRNNQNWVVFEIQDSGIGIPPEQLPHIFGAFIQSDWSIARKYGGTGLGLTISQRLCQLLGGTIDVESAVGQGSTFTVCLPQYTGWNEQVSPSGIST